MTGKHDRQESDADIQPALQIIRAASLKYTALTTQLSPPVEGSMLEAERTHTAREPIDALVMSHRARAKENLDRVLEMMIDQENGLLRAYPYSQYSLLRTAIEAVATAMWLIKSSKKKDRVLHALQLSYRNHQEALTFSELVTGTVASAPARAKTEQIVRRLEELKNTVGPLRQIELGPPPKYTRILTVISTKNTRGAVPYDIGSPLVVWKVCSAFLHGSDQVIRALSDIRQIGAFNDGIASFEISPSIRMLAVTVNTCIDLLAELDDRYNFLASHDYASREVASRGSY